MAESALVQAYITAFYECLCMPVWPGKRENNKEKDRYD
jgi:hypothetical protein